MAIPDLAPFLLAVTETNPCGDNLEYDSQFLYLEKVIEGKPEVQYGDTVMQATAPDWRQVEALAIELLVRSRDLRIVAHLTQALLAQYSFSGFAVGLALLEGLLERYWHVVHPQLDSQDDNDPTTRLNTLLFLINEDLLRDVRNAPLLVSKTQGTLSLRDLEYALGELPLPPDMAPASLALIESQLSQMTEAISAIEKILGSIAHISQIVIGQVGVVRSIDFSPLLKILKCAHDFFSKRLNPNASRQATAALAQDSECDSFVNDLKTPRCAITTQEDVVATIDRICAYYEIREPSSPVALLLRRAQRLVGKDFIEILQDLVPDALHQAKQISGID
ncbi:Uncharacterized protein MCB1EB_1897 [Mycoavidus cysteinexigens]|uniref:Uncharacterized protein n=1 Tax=Mycoavidus cysteinexigens TaxID=1553431 RepID=A0A2Z6EXG7_9BURK|nr:type VI secretion system protein TssA [Mycoavidus cysteinexigens]BBE10058.1 Uncharacterized protein MCB1EB_1897 [Mycoavidus cysteinexigens]GAM53600.1 uncharacterized protein ImpA [bacterium endosymbiont of Mortierella elongata FMR23-6]GLR00474.1 hypothetical protein GCM10007934_02850 [Mycoavidus cysteinexigens]